MDTDARTLEGDPRPAVPDAARSRPRWVAPALIGATAAAGTAALAFVNPTDSGMPVCVSQGLLGIDCPLCGGLRCVSSLARGDLLGAADHNVLLALALPIVTVVWVWWLVRSVRDRPLRLPAIPSGVIVAVAVVLLVFTLLRNLDGGPALEWLASTRSG